MIEMFEVFSPQYVIDRHPLTLPLAQCVQQARQQAQAILSGKDRRLLVIMGPCSIHEPQATIEYAQRLKEVMTLYQQQLHIVMRVYLEKPRTTMGWKGWVKDPHLDGSYAVNDGLLLARQLLCDIGALGVPTATEFLDVFTSHYTRDLITWGAIGARTTESPMHRELASSLTLPVGFKNNREGNIHVAVDAIEVAQHTHHIFSIDRWGKTVFLQTPGNPHCHLVLRGASHATNYDPVSVQRSVEHLRHKKLLPYLMVDCSHDNSEKMHAQQLEVARSLSAQILAGNTALVGVMLESFLLAGRQTLTHKAGLQYGQSITDACLSWEQTTPLLENFAESVARAR